VRFPKMGAIPFLTHEHMLYRLEQLLQAGHAEVSICKMGSFGCHRQALHSQFSASFLALPIVTCRRFPRRSRSRRLTLTPQPHGGPHADVHTISELD
jgi:hypothetical protein